MDEKKLKRINGPSDYLRAVYFEGFKEKWVFDPYSEANRRRFSVCLRADPLHLIEFVRRLREGRAATNTDRGR